MKEKMAFRIRQYGRTELAQCYCPDIAPESAWRKFKRWINRYPGLPERLAAQGYHPRQRCFTPAQVREVVEALGEP